MSFDATALRVDPNRPFRWDDYPTDARCGFADKAAARKRLADDVQRLTRLHDVFGANATYGLLIVVQGVDAAGKDGIIKHVMKGLNPQGVRVYAFRQPTPKERAHDFLWRSAAAVPERGRIAIFNRSYYEEVLVVRVDPENIAAERLPPELRTQQIWEQRFQQINNFERYLVDNGILVLKFMLNVSRERQLERLLARIDEPQKRWKFSASDLETPRRWDGYREAYAEMLHRTTTGHAPWYVIPADRKWVTRLAVAAITVERLEGLRLSYPQPPPSESARFAEARDYLRGELGRSHDEDSKTDSSRVDAP